MYRIYLLCTILLLLLLLLPGCASATQRTQVAQALRSSSYNTSTPHVPQVTVEVGVEEVYPGYTVTPEPTRTVYTVEAQVEPAVPLSTLTITPSSETFTVTICMVSVFDAGNAGNAGNEVTSDAGNPYLHFRACPGISCNVIGWLPEGTYLLVLPNQVTIQTETWTQVTYLGRTGWINQRYCQEVK